MPEAYECEIGMSILVCFLYSRTFPDSNLIRCPSHLLPAVMAPSRRILLLEKPESVRMLPSLFRSNLAPCERNVTRRQTVNARVSKSYDPVAKRSITCLKGGTI